MLPPPSNTKEEVAFFREKIFELFKQDATNMREGIYPFSVLTPETPHRHAQRFPKIIFDGFKIYWRRKRNKTKDFSSKAKKYLEDMPAYYKRNFHFQTDGYLSEQSAELYEHQVETLFSGSADAMRRIFLRPLKERLRGQAGTKLKILEIAIGTGRTTRFTRLAFPQAKIVATDISYPYLKFAQKQLSDLDRIDFLQADATQLPLNSGEFDVVTSIFLFHELPPEERKQVLAEAFRVLKPGGIFTFVDSLQKNDWSPANTSLEQFPMYFHEPFYKHYVENPMEDYMKDMGFQNVNTSLGFVSKTCIGTRPEV